MSFLSLPAARKRRWRAYFFLLLNVILWGAALPVVKPALSFVSPFQYLFYRYLIAVLLGLPLLWKYRRFFFHKQLLMLVALEFIGTTLSLSFLYFGLNQSSVITTGLITNTYPLFVTMGGIIFLKEREERHEWIGTLVAFAGALGLLAVPILATRAANLTAGTVTSNLLLAIHLLFSAAYALLVKKYYHRLPALVPAIMSCVMGFLTFGALSWWQAQWSLAAFSAQTWLNLKQPSVLLAAGYMGTMGTLGLIAFLKGQDEIEASEASLFSYLLPLVYIPMSVMFLGERIRLAEMMLLGIVLAGVIIAEKRHHHHHAAAKATLSHHHRPPVQRRKS